MFLAKKITRFLIFGTYLFQGSSIYSYEYSIKNAFCVDFAFNNSNWTSKTSQYDYQKMYNYCFKNANSLIDEYEAKQKKSIKEYNIRKQKELENIRNKKMLKKRQEIEKNYKLNEIRKNMDYLFK